MCHRLVHLGTLNSRDHVIRKSRTRELAFELKFSPYKHLHDGACHDHFEVLKFGPRPLKEAHLQLRAQSPLHLLMTTHVMTKSI